MNSITYSLAPVSPEFTGGAKVYRAIVQTKGTIDPDALCEALAERTKQDKSMWIYFLAALNDQLGEMLLDGYRVNLGQLSTGFVIKGAFASEDEKFDPAKHTLVPTVRALDPLKSAITEATVENLTVGLTCVVRSLMDAVTKELNVINGSNEVHIQGERIGIDTENIDEFVRLVKDDGTVAAEATVMSSDAQTITCKFETPPEAGVYTLVVSARNGCRATLAPAVSTVKNITVKVG